jgi:hypothetical protein
MEIDRVEFRQRSKWTADRIEVVVRLSKGAHLVFVYVPFFSSGSDVPKFVGAVAGTRFRVSNGA